MSQVRDTLRMAELDFSSKIQFCHSESFTIFLGTPQGVCAIWRMCHLANEPFGECAIWRMYHLATT
jgi:hypothetical protein